MGTRRFITVFTRARHSPISWVRWIHSTPSEQIYLRFVLILSSHLCLVLPIGLFPSGFLSTTLCAPLLSPIRVRCPAHLIFLGLITRITFAEVYRSCGSSLCSLLYSLVTSSLLGLSIFLSALFSNTVSLCSSLSVTESKKGMELLLLPVVHFHMFRAYVYAHGNINVFVTTTQLITAT